MEDHTDNLHKFIVNNTEYLIPKVIVDDSITIQNIIQDTDTRDSIIFYMEFPHLDKLDQVDNPVILPILDFLNCPNLMTITGMKLIENSNCLDGQAKRIFYGLPKLAYQAHLKGLMEVDELPKWDDSILISSEEWVEFIGGNSDKLITLLNLNIPPSLLLPEITVGIITRVANSLEDNHQSHCRCCVHEREVENPLIPMLRELVNRLVELKPEVLESLIYQFRYAVILDRMVELKMIDVIRRIHASGIIPDKYDCSSLVVKMEDDEMIDLIMELKLIDDSNPNPNYVREFLLYALENNYAYPLKFIPPEVQLDQIIPITITINLSEENLYRLIPQSEQLYRPMFMLGIIRSGRIELAKQWVKLMNAELLAVWEHVKSGIPLAIFQSREDYREIVELEPILTLESVSTSLILNNSCGQLIVQLLEELDHEEKLTILYVSLSMLMDINGIINLEFYTILMDQISLEEFKNWLRCKYESIRQECSPYKNVEEALQYSKNDNSFRARMRRSMIMLVFDRRIDPAYLASRALQRNMIISITYNPSELNHRWDRIESHIEEYIRDYVRDNNDDPYYNETNITELIQETIATARQRLSEYIEVFNHRVEAQSRDNESVNRTINNVDSVIGLEPSSSNIVDDDCTDIIPDKLVYVRSHELFTELLESIRIRDIIRNKCEPYIQAIIEVFRIVSKYSDLLQ